MIRFLIGLVVAIAALFLSSLPGFWFLAGPALCLGLLWSSVFQQSHIEWPRAPESVTIYWFSRRITSLPYP